MLEFSRALEDLLLFCFVCVCVCVCNKSTFNLRFYACLSYDLIFLVENLWKCLYRREILSFKVSALNRRWDDSHV